MRANFDGPAALLTYHPTVQPRFEHTGSVFGAGGEHTSVELRAWFGYDEADRDSIVEWSMSAWSDLQTLVGIANGEAKSFNDAVKREAWSVVQKRREQLAKLQELASAKL